MLGLELCKVTPQSKAGLPGKKLDLDEPMVTFVQSFFDEPRGDDSPSHFLVDGACTYGHHVLHYCFGFTLNNSEMPSRNGELLCTLGE